MDLEKLRKAIEIHKRIDYCDKLAKALKSNAVSDIDFTIYSNGAEGCISLRSDIDIELFHIVTDGILMDVMCLKNRLVNEFEKL